MRLTRPEDLLQKAGDMMFYESSSKDQKRILLMAVSLMIAVSIIVLGLTLWMLYRSNFQQRVEGLQAMVRGQVDLIESVTRFDQQHSQKDVEGGAGAATLLQVTCLSAVVCNLVRSLYGGGDPAWNWLANTA
jgi:alpha-N-acetylglucosamine transferase